MFCQPQHPMSFSEAAHSLDIEFIEHLLDVGIVCKVLGTQQQQQQNETHGLCPCLAEGER